MKINSVYLASFGKFKDYRLDFSDGFNTIYGENEKGKTTIMNFIRMMFYGTSGKSSDTTKNLRKKYLPFDSDLMAGSIDFDHNGVSYTLERVFKASNAGDKLKLINHNTGNIESFSGKSDIGSTFFGLNESSFEKSVFIGNLSVFPQGDEDGELNSKLSNITTSMDEDVSLELVKSRLLKAKETLMSRSGKIGVYDKAKQKLVDTELALSDAEKREDRAFSIQSLIAEKKASLDIVQKESARLFELLKNAKMLGLKASLEKCLVSFEEIETLEEKISLKNGNIADKVFLEELKSAALNLEKAKIELIKKEEEHAKVSLSLEQLKNGENSDILSLKNEKALLEKELDALKIEAEALNNKINTSNQTSSKHTLLALVGGLVLLLGISLGFVYKLLFSLCPIGLILLILGLIFSKKQGANSKKGSAALELESKIQKKHEIEEKLESLNLAINNLLIEDATRKALTDSKTADFLQLKEKVLLAKEEELNAKNTLNSILLALNFNGNTENVDIIIKELEETLSLINTEKGKLAFIYEQTGCSSKEEAEARLLKINSDTKLNGMSAEELETAQKKLKEISDEKNLLSADIASLGQELKNLLSSGETSSILRIKLEEIKKELKRQKDFCDSADLALSSLDEAFSDLRHSFSYILEEKTAKIFKSLTGGNYTSVNVSKDFQIGVTAKDSFGTKEWQYLSLGTAGQAYLALRLALAELISDESSPLPLLLDDSLSEYDDIRAEIAMNFLKEYSKNSQIILFTCHSGIADMAKNLDSNIKYL